MPHKHHKIVDKSKQDLAKFEAPLIAGSAEAHHDDDVILRQKRTVKLLYVVQLTLVLTMVMFFLYAHQSLVRLERRKTCCGEKTTANQKSELSSGNRNRKSIARRDTVSEEQPANALPTLRTYELVELPGGVRMLKENLELACDSIQTQCAQRDLTLSGIPGPKGETGDEGFAGVKGQRGDTGYPGIHGVPGDHGDAGIDGKDATCSCDFEKIRNQGKSTLPIPPTSTLTLTSLPPVTTVNVTVTNATTTPIVTADMNTTSTAPTTTTTTPQYTGPPTLGTNRRDCRLRPSNHRPTFGLPVPHGYSSFSFCNEDTRHYLAGAFLRDSDPEDSNQEKRRFVRPCTYSEKVFQFLNEATLDSQTIENTYFLRFISTGTGVVMNKRQLYYHRWNTNQVVAYNLTRADLEMPDASCDKELEIPNMAYQDCEYNSALKSFETCNETQREAYLYNIPHNFIDLAVDENGLWVIYHYTGEDYIVVSKLQFAEVWENATEPVLNIVRTWNLTHINVSEIENGFILCGVFYGLESGTESRSNIKVAYDLYNSENFTVTMNWRNPYKNTVMLDYNPVDERMYVFDNGHLLSNNRALEDDQRAH